MDKLRQPLIHVLLCQFKQITALDTMFADRLDHRQQSTASLHGLLGGGDQLRRGARLQVETDERAQYAQEGIVGGVETLRREVGVAGRRTGGRVRHTVGDPFGGDGNWPRLRVGHVHAR